MTGDPALPRARQNITLRNVSADDLPIFFDQQLDAEANDMAAFTADDPYDRAAFDAHWARILGNPSIILRTILVGSGEDREVAGYLASFERWGSREVSYWLGKVYLGSAVSRPPRWASS